MTILSTLVSVRVSVVLFISKETFLEIIIVWKSQLSIIGTFSKIISISIILENVENRINKKSVYAGKASVAKEVIFSIYQQCILLKT